MFLKEIKDTLKQAGSIMSFLVVIPLIYLLDSSFYRTGTTFPEYIAGGFAILWLITVGYLAYNMFRPEEKDNAVEYILSLPISRWKLMVWKTVPRVAVLIILIGTPLSFTFNYIPIWMIAFIIFAQVCGFTLGIVGRKSWVTKLMLFVMMICVFIINSVPPALIWKDQVPVSGLMNILAEFGFLALILIPIYRNWDLKPVRVREVLFEKRAIVPLILLAYPVVYMLSS